MNRDNLKNVRHRHHDALSRLSWQDFERLLADHFRAQGFEVEHCGTAGSTRRYDGGVDLRLRKNQQLTLVQAKHENAKQVPHNVVHELLGVKVNEGAARAIVITSGEFTAAALRAGKQGHVELVDGVELRRILGGNLPREAADEPSEKSSQAIVFTPVTHIADWRAGRGRSIIAPINTSPPNWKRRRKEANPEAMQVIGGILLLLFALFGLPHVLQSSMKRAVSDGHIPESLPRQPRPAPIPTVNAQLSKSSPIRLAPASVAPEPDLARAAVAPLGREVPVQPTLTKAQQAEREAEVQRYLDRVPQLTHYRAPPPGSERAQAAPTGDVPNP